jgi:putative Mg2+ transporter-C (MgtC) family protein
MNFIEAYGDQLMVLANLVLAMFLGGLVGWEREVADKPAGLRTHMLIAGASALFVSLGTSVVRQFSGELGGETIEAAPLRIIQAVVAGVSFLGAGTIIRGEHGRVAGLTTAASVLFTAALGVSVSIGQYVVAAGATLLLLVTLRVLVVAESRIAKTEE